MIIGRSLDQTFPPRAPAEAAAGLAFTSGAAGRPPNDAIAPPSFLQPNAETLRFALPAWICLALVLLATQGVLGNVFGNVFGNFAYFNALLVLSTFLLVLALGQGAVIPRGGLDLSLPWTIGFSGILLAGVSGQASLGRGDDDLLPSIAVVVVGGALITGGRGHYLGMVGGALLLTALQTLLAGTTPPYAFRAIVFGGVVLAAVIALYERRT